MRSRAALLIAWEELRSHPLRTFLGALSVTIGVTSVLLVLSLADSAPRAMKEEYEKRTGWEATYQIDLAGQTENDVVWILDRLARYGVSAAPVREGGASVGMSGTQYAVSPRLRHVRYLPLVEGRWLNEQDGRRLVKAYVVNQPLARLLAPDASTPVGMKLPGAVVVGVVDDDGDRPSYYVHWQAGPTAIDHEPRWRVVFTATPESRVSEALARDLAIVYPDHAFEIRRTDAADSFRRVLLLIQAILAGVAALTLAVGALGLLNIGLSSVKERVRDFGIRRSFGAPARVVFAAVLWESVLTTTVAAVLGVGLAAICLRLAPQLQGISFAAATLSVRALVIAFGITLATGLLVGLVPARRATRMRVIDAIRR